MKIAFLDTETTGLDPDSAGGVEHEVIDLCICIWENGVQAPWYRKRFMPIGPCDPGAQRVNGYSPEEWAKDYGGSQPAQTFTAADAAEIAAFLSQADMIGGAATHFDVRMLKLMFRRVRAEWPKTIPHRLVDVQPLAMPLLLAGHVKSVSLQSLCDVFQLGKVAHTAPGDVSLTMQVFERLLSVYWPSIAPQPAQGAAA